MNTASNTLPEPTPVTATGDRPATRTFCWSVRRELWENRSIYIAPLIVAGVELFGFLLSSIGLPERRRAVLLLEPAKARAAIEVPYDMAAIMLILTAFVIGVFYCLDALYGERRERSISVLEVAAGFGSHNGAFQDECSVGCSAADYIRDHRNDAGSDAALDQCPAYHSWHESRIDLDIFALVSAVPGAALRAGSDRDLARTDLRVGAVGFGLGPTRDLSLGSVTGNRDRCLREDHLRHFAFCRTGERSLTRVCTECLLIRTASWRCNRLTGTTHSGPVSEHAGSLAWISVRSCMYRCCNPAPPLSRATLISTLN